MPSPLPRSALARAVLPFLLGLALVLLTACGKNPPPPADHARGSAIAATARTQVGKPYRHGGTTPARGFDCSGLVYWACAQNGIAVPRESKAQAGAGREVQPQHLLPGDIVVFKIWWSGYHTGIYLGQGRFVHSPRPRTRVRIESLSSPYWKKAFVSGRRVALL
jgi:cell wall-associated NlpC family hydrolase